MTLKDWRKSNYITQRELAATLGITPALLCMIEKGKAKISLKVNRKFKDIYGFTLGEKNEER